MFPFILKYILFDSVSLRDVVSDNQKTTLLRLLEENPSIIRGECKEKKDRLAFWDKVSKILNNEGPCIRSPHNWRVVNINSFNNF